MTKPELLAPAGNLEKLHFAITYGADAVYVGGPNYSLRAQAGNFDWPELAAGVAFAHAKRAKLYVAVNIYAHNQHLVNLPSYLHRLAGLGVDGLIISDPGIFRLAKKEVPQLALHISTQSNSTNSQTVAFWAELGAKRVVLAREVSLAECAEIAAANPGIDLEIFVHGAMCMAYSGRCLLSAYLTGRSANLGDCAQPCRWQYRLEEEKRPGEYFPIVEDEWGTYIFNSKDLCLIEYLPQILASGVQSLKIEGRMKSAYYVSCVTGTYRQALDACLAAPQKYAAKEGWLSELKKVSHRQYSTGFAFGNPGEKAQKTASSAYERGYDFAGFVKEYDAASGRILVEQRNHLAVGDVVEVLTPGGGVTAYQIKDMWSTKTGLPQKTAPHAKEQVWMSVPAPFVPYSILRRPVKEA